MTDYLTRLAARALGGASEPPVAPRLRSPFEDDGPEAPVGVAAEPAAPAERQKPTAPAERPEPAAPREAPVAAPRAEPVGGGAPVAGPEAARVEPGTAPPSPAPRVARSAAVARETPRAPVPERAVAPARGATDAVRGEAVVRPAVAGAPRDAAPDPGASPAAPVPALPDAGLPAPVAALDDVVRRLTGGAPARAAEVSAEPVVRVTIGRIDVRPAAPAPAPRPVPARPERDDRLSAYLRGEETPR